MYYLLTKQQYDSVADMLTELPAWNLNGSMCIAHYNGNLELNQYNRIFATSTEAIEYRNSPENTAEWDLTDEELFLV